MKINKMQSARPLLIFIICSLLSSPLRAEQQITAETGVGKEISTIIAAEQNPYLIRSGFPKRVEDVTALYKLTGNQLLWLGNSNAEKNIRAALSLLASANQQGLNPANYDVDVLQQKLPAALALSENDNLQLALYDTALSLSMIRFAHDLHYGSVDPKKFNFNLKPRSKKLLDIPQLIKNGVATGNIAQLPGQIEPKLRQYGKLKQALAKYSELARTKPPLKLTIRKNVRIGAEYPQLAELQDFLVAVGDLPEDKAQAASPATTLRYSIQIADAVKNFQQRHGIPATGHLDRDTVNALNVPLTERVEQIKLAMERVRWLPEFSPGPAVIVNIPAFQLWAFDDIEAEHPNVVNINVVVGKSEKNQTPVLMADMKFVNFQPYWNVPPNILKEEILPKLAKGGGFLASQNMEVVANYGNPAKTVPLNAMALDKLKRGIFRVRQRPGKGNALGKIKFLFPNSYDVYLHDTPSKPLFKRTRRDFSHGCVRVEYPEVLADFVFKNQKGWDKAAIRKAMKNPKLQEVTLDKYIPVLLFYSTSFMNEKDELMFYPDIYSRDRPLEVALTKPEDLADVAIFAPPPPPKKEEILQPSVNPLPASAKTVDPIPEQLME